MNGMEKIVREGLTELGIQAPAEAPALLAQFGAALLEQNKVMNLTAITDPASVASLHMLDCAALLGCAGLAGKTLIDVGTGAGFPGIPLKILVPSLDATLLDALGKRVDWLNESCKALGLDGIRAIQGRAEEAGRDPSLRGQFDFATARAVAELRVLCELCLPFVKVGGTFLAMKSVGCDKELEEAQDALSLLGGQAVRHYDYRIPQTEVVHRIVVVRKVGHTPERYPRRWAKIQKSPL